MAENNFRYRDQREFKRLASTNFILGRIHANTGFLLRKSGVALGKLMMRHIS